MDERKASILRTVVERYVATAQPVASSAVASAPGVEVSSATIRNEMNFLEREGYIAQPHTSAGRVPTDLGYRFFVDHLASGALPTGDLRTVSDFFETAYRALEDVLNETSQLLARLTHHAAMVIGPQPDAATIRSVQLVLLQPTAVLVVAVLSNGAVEKEFLHLECELTEDQVATSARTLGEAIVGQTIGSVAAALPNVLSLGDRDLASLAFRSLTKHIANSSPEAVFIGGASRIAAEQEAFSTTHTAARLLELLEQQFVVVTLVRDLIEGGVTVRIGGENERNELRECSLVLAPYDVNGEVGGTLAVIGPTRMDYPQAIAAVAAVSKRLGAHLSG